LLRALGCSEMQGYLFSPPRPAAEIRQLCFSHRGSPIALSPARKRRQGSAKG
jgi:predicted signal transduction protein with EAL and GGDEF domain